MAVTTATLRYGVIGNTTDFGSVIGESYSSTSTKLTQYYESRPNTLFGRGMSETTQVLSLSRIFRDAHC